MTPKQKPQANQAPSEPAYHSSYISLVCRLWQCLHTLWGQSVHFELPNKNSDFRLEGLSQLRIAQTPSPSARPGGVCCQKVAGGPPSRASEAPDAGAARVGRRPAHRCSSWWRPLGRATQRVGSAHLLRARRHRPRVLGLWPPTAACPVSRATTPFVRGGTVGRDAPFNTFWRAWQLLRSGGGRQRRAGRMHPSGRICSKHAVVGT